MKTHFSIQSALTSGLIATIAMTVFTYMAPLMGFEMNIPKMLSTTMGAPLAIGWVAHFMIGEVLAVSFAAIFLARTNKPANLKSGALFGLVPWLMAQVIVMPMLALLNRGSYFSGFFSGSLIIAMASLIGHLIYGGVLGSVYKPKVAAVPSTF